MERPGIRQFTMSQLPGRLAVVQLAPGSTIPAWAAQGSLSAIVRTTVELTVVCDETVVPDDAQAEKGWAALMLDGPLPFSMTGVLSSILEPLAAGQIPVYVLSTFDTDCVLIKADQVEQAVLVLERGGHTVRRSKQT
jgi:hypothetical protein